MCVRAKLTPLGSRRGKQVAFFQVSGQGQQQKNSSRNRTKGFASRCSSGIEIVKEETAVSSSPSTSTLLHHDHHTASTPFQKEQRHRADATIAPAELTVPYATLASAPGLDQASAHDTVRRRAPIPSSVSRRFFNG